jgi:hypothetical protein
MGKGVLEAVRIIDWRNSYSLESRILSELEENIDNPDWDVRGIPEVVFFNSASASYTYIYCLDLIRRWMNCVVGTAKLNHV